MMLGEAAVSGEEARAARIRLSLSQAILTRASSLSLARSLGASRLIVIRCDDALNQVDLEAQAFDSFRPEKGDAIRISGARTQIATMIDSLARRLAPDHSAIDTSGFRAPSPASLLAAALAFNLEGASERARGLIRALDLDPSSIDLRLSAVEALMTARDFEAAIKLATTATAANAPPILARALGFLKGIAQLEAGRYAEASEGLEALRRSGETAAVLNNLGVARFRLRDPAAAQLFERAGSLSDRRQADISFNRSLALLFSGKADLALPAIDQALQASPADVRTRLLRVWTLRTLNRENERAHEWERLMSAAPSFASLAIPDLARRLERILYSEQWP